MDHKLADAAFHPHDGLVLPRQAQERRVIHALDVTIAPGRDCLPVPLRQREQCRILFFVNRPLSEFPGKSRSTATMVSSATEAIMLEAWIEEAM